LRRKKTHNHSAKKHDTFGQGKGCFHCLNLERMIGGGDFNRCETEQYPLWI